MAEDEPTPLLAWQNEVMILLEKCQKCAVQSPGSFVKALQSLHRTLIHPTMHSSPPERETISDRKRILDGKSGKIQPVSAFADSIAQQDFLRNVAEEVIRIERVIFSVDEEVDGAHSSYSFDYEDDCKWYNDALNKVRHTEVQCNARRDSETTFTAYDRTGSEICNDPERCIDKCLDACGYTLSLDAAVDCLRRIVHDSSSEASSSATYSAKNELQKRKKSKGHGFAEAITSLRTVRRRLLLIPASRSEEGFNIIYFPKPYQHAMACVKDMLGDQIMRNFQCMILPLEYHDNQQTYQDSNTHHDQQQRQQTRLLSDSLSSLARSVLPTLVSAACYAVDLPLPSWATPKISYGLLFHCAWRNLLMGELIGECCATPPARDCLDPPRVTLFAGNTDSPDATNHLIMNHIPSITDNHFQSLVRQMIESGRSDIIAHQLYKIWKFSGIEPSSTHPRDSATPRSILCRQLESIIGSVPSKRKVAIFCRAIVLDCAKQEISQSGHTRQQTRDQLDGVCKTDILPFLCGVMLPSLAKDDALVDSIVQFIILSPPTSYHGETRPSQTYPTIQAIDRAVPRCLAHLLALTRESRVNEAKSFQDVSDSGETDADSHHSFMEVHGFLMNLYTAANVWCEDVFVTRTDTRRQQYVTEFLLQPLECKLLTKEDLQKSLSDDGTTLAAVLVQGVSLRLDVSRSESIRIDGMLVAEAMASLLGQTLRFDELHEDDAGIIVKEVTETRIEKKEKRRIRKKRVLEPRAPAVVDPDALLSYDSESSARSSHHDSSSSSCGKSDESSDSISSWGEDSLQPYRLDDDEEDLSRVPRPRTLRDCLAYLITSESDTLAYDKHHAALTELAPIINAQPLDLHDVISTLVRVLLFLEDKFSMDQFAEKRWVSLMAIGVNAPTEMCLLLVTEMRGNISLGTRLEILSILKDISQDLSGARGNSQKHLNDSNYEISHCSTKLLRALRLNDASNGDEDATTELDVQYSKTRRWRKHCTPTTSTPNRFGAVSVQMIYSLFSFLSQTRTDESIWGGSVGEKFLSEFLKSLAIMLYCASTYPSSALLVFATDLSDLAWSFRTAKCSEVRHAALLAMLTCVSLLPLESVMQRAYGTGSFLKQCSELDDSSDCRHVASLILGRVSEMMNQNLIGS
ncbi:hypothetical protein ACHAW5_005586 [Stephanodiscus triporus]|uniref:Telomere length regulation protein conserved domain-containing protein n=1 Tax=Stephanodiscus triporus TaxID=2934178 RepID=A0ABD3PQ56_9STRA